jgi:hypothetical protein
MGISGSPSSTFSGSPEILLVDGGTTSTSYSQSRDQCVLRNWGCDDNLVSYYSSDVCVDAFATKFWNFGRNLILWWSAKGTCRN